MDKNYSLSLPSDTQIIMQRNFDAPRELVFRAYTDPELVPQWWGLRIATTTVDKLDLRVGGKWRWVQTMPDGTEFGFRGEY
ncbi:MAG: SRPBCC domain-containing protein, partial [Thermomicrobiales bacterium]